jgi:2OG-Fe(II) oxygenase superfamily
VTYLAFERLDALDDTEFRATAPYPWLSREGLLTDSGYGKLLAGLPDVSIFERAFGVKRAHGQQPHDRYVLEYSRELPVSPAWHEFVEELRGERYTKFLKRMFGRGRLMLTFHWHYTPNGCSVSPHCDNVRKLGSHIFYFNTERDWQPGWGGDTVILDDEGRFRRSSAPRFEEFVREHSAPSRGNRSLLFARRDKSWHGVREIRCPEGALRKVFIVIVNDRTLVLATQATSWLTGKRVAGY